MVLLKLLRTLRPVWDATCPVAVALPGHNMCACNLKSIANSDTSFFCCADGWVGWHAAVGIPTGRARVAL